MRRIRVQAEIDELQGTMRSLQWRLFRLQDELQRMDESPVAPPGFLRFPIEIERGMHFEGVPVPIRIR